MRPTREELTKIAKDWAEREIEAVVELSVSPRWDAIGLDALPLLDSSDYTQDEIDEDAMNDDAEQINDLARDFYFEIFEDQATGAPAVG